MKQKQLITIIQDSFNITTISIMHQKIIIEVKVELYNHTNQIQKDTISYINLVDEIEEVVVEPKSTYLFTKQYELEDIDLWDISHPDLYEITLQTKDDKVSKIIAFYIDEWKEGIFYHNHQKVELNCAIVTDDYGLLGNQSYEDYEYYRIAKLKDAFFNAVYYQGKIIPDGLINACKELGMYLLDQKVGNTYGFDTVQNNGEFDITGQRKPVSFLHAIQLQKANRPFIVNKNEEAIYFGEEGKEIEMIVYASSPSVELFINDLSLGIQDIHEYKCSYTFPYEPGTLRAKAYYPKKITRCTLTSPEDLDAINTTVFEGNEFDIVEIQLVDFDGNQINIPTTLKVEGDYIAFGSTSTLKPDSQNEILVEKGRALLITNQNNTLEANGIKVSIFDDE